MFNLLDIGLVKANDMFGLQNWEYEFRIPMFVSQNWNFTESKFIES